MTALEMNYYGHFLKISFLATVQVEPKLKIMKLYIHCGLLLSLEPERSSSFS